MFDSPLKLFLGLITGIAFGFFLQKGRVAKYNVLMGQFFLKDWTVAKIMVTAIAVGSVGVYAMKEAGWVSLDIKPALFGGVIVGALLFGIGMAILGLCPGTSVAACGEGRRDAMVGILGMLFGAGIYVAFYSSLQPVIQSLGNWGKVTLPEVTHTSPWLWIVILVGLTTSIFYLVERRRQFRSPDSLVHKHA